MISENMISENKGESQKIWRHLKKRKLPALMQHRQGQVFIKLPKELFSKKKSVNNQINIESIHDRN